MKKSFADRRSGFTLVELLIVIIIIGVLAGMMMMAAGAAADKAKAARVISDVRTMASAAVMYHSEYGAWPIWVSSSGKYTKYGTTKITPETYVGAPATGDDYWVGAMYSGSDADFAFAVADVSKVDESVRKVIANQASALSFYGSGGHNSSPTESDLTVFKAADKEIIKIIGKH